MIKCHEPPLLGPQPLALTLILDPKWVRNRVPARPRIWLYGLVRGSNPGSQIGSLFWQGPRHPYWGSNMPILDHRSGVPSGGPQIPGILGHVSSEEMHIRHYSKSRLFIFVHLPIWVGSWTHLVSDLESHMLSGSRICIRIRRPK